MIWKNYLKNNKDGQTKIGKSGSPKNLTLAKCEQLNFLVPEKIESRKNLSPEKILSPENLSPENESRKWVPKMSPEMSPEYWRHRFFKNFEMEGNRRNLEKSLFTNQMDQMEGWCQRPKFHEIGCSIRWIQL